jgi:hypothetical protein
MPSLIAKCPVTGADVFPDMSVAREAGAHLVVCPACGREHKWKPGASTLIDIGPATDTVFTDRRGTCGPAGKDENAP